MEKPIIKWMMIWGTPMDWKPPYPGYQAFYDDVDPIMNSIGIYWRYCPNI
jgi:hypothetical protein